MNRKKSMESAEILEKIRIFAERNNIHVYLVGGYIRDRFLRRKSNDIDIVMERDALSFA